MAKVRQIRITDYSTKKVRYKEVTSEEHNKILEDIGRDNLNIEVKLMKEREL